MPDKVMVTKAKLDSLAEAVGSKSGQGVPLTIEGMEDAVLGIETGIQPSGTLAISKNGTHDVTKYASARVKVPTPAPKLQSKTAYPSIEYQSITADNGYDGLAEVIISGMPIGSVYHEYITVNSSGVVTASYSLNEGYFDYGTHTITKQLPTTYGRTITPRDYAQTVVSVGTYAVGNVVVSAVSLQEKSVTPVFDVALQLVPESDYTGLSQVTVEAIPYSEENNDYGGKTVTIG